VHRLSSFTLLYWKRRWLTTGSRFFDRDFADLRRLTSISLGQPNHRQSQDYYERGACDCRSADSKTKNKRLSSAALPLTGQARPQAHLKVFGRSHRLKPADQLAQTGSLRAKAATRRA